MEHAIQPIMFKTEDGAERKFRLTNSRLRDFLAGRADTESSLDSLFRFLWLTCDTKTEGMTLDQFMDLFPPDVELLNGLVEEINARHNNKSKFEENDRYRPKQAATPPSPGSGS